MSTVCWSWRHVRLVVSLKLQLCIRCLHRPCTVLMWLMLVYWRRWWSNSGGSVVGSESRLFSLVFNDPYSRLVSIFLIVMLVSTRGAASVQKGRHDVRRRSSDRGWVTPDWEVFGCALSPCIPSRLLVEIRWRDVGENSSQQVGVDFIAPKRRR